jgi:hypothetical protein
MSTEVSDVRDPDCIRLSHIELPLQMVRCHHGCRTAAFEATLALPCLRVQASGTHDAVDTIDPALLAEIAQVIRDFPVAVHRTASQPGLLDGPEQAPVFQGPLAIRLGTPGIKSAGVHCHHLHSLRIEWSVRAPRMKAYLVLASWQSTRRLFSRCHAPQ